MLNKRMFVLGLLLCWLLVQLPGPVCAQAEKAAAGKKAGSKVTLDFKDVELTDLIQTVSEMTGKNFIYDESIKGKVTIISPSPMSLDEAYHLFLTVLNVKGFTVVPAGRVNKIVATGSAKESTLPFSAGTTGDQYVTRLLPLQNLDATVMATTVLPPLIPKTSNVVAYPPSNTLIITDTAANIERLAQILKELDIPSTLELLEVIHLEYAAADEVALVANQIMAQAAAGPRGRGAAGAQAGGKEPSKIIPYSRTNTLIVMASGDDLQTIKSLIARLDQKPEQARSSINVYYLENADAETLAKTLNEILSGIKAKTGRPAQAAGQPPAASEPVSITADKPTNSLIVNSSPEDFETIKGLIKQLDIKRKQVFVEALILELGMDATKRLGASLQGALAIGDENVVFGTSNLNTGPVGLANLASGSSGASGSSIPSILSQTIEGILLGGLFSPITVPGLDGKPVTIPAFSALIDIAKTDTDVNILSAPRLLTSDNEEAEIIVGSNVPIISSRLTNAVGSATDSGTGLATSVAVERKDVALTLRFTPQVTEGDLVRLKVYQEITDIAVNSVGDVNQVGPTLTKRLLRNTVLAENGKTIVLGGLIGNNHQERIVKTPFLGDIPYLGWLFKRKRTSDLKTNLLVFITPRVIKNGEDLEEVTRKSRDSMTRFRLEEMRSDLPPGFIEAERGLQHSPAESGQPQTGTP